MNLLTPIVSPLPKILSDKRGFIGFLRDTNNIIEREKAHRLDKIMIEGSSLDTLKFSAGFLNGLSLVQGLLTEKIKELTKEE